MNEDPSKSLLSSVVNQHTTDAVVDIGESLLDDWSDSLLDNEIVKEIPVIKTLVGLSKGAITFKEQLYTRKLMTFLFETSKASEEDRKKYQKKLDKNPDECNRAGETIFNIIDKITNAEKAKMIGQVFRAFMHEDDLTATQVIYLCEIIDRAHLQDLKSLRDSEIHNESNLEAVGIRKPMRVEDVNNAIEEALKNYEETQDRNMRLASSGMSTVSPKYPKIEQSGLTDAGYNLLRILRSYQ